MADIFISYKKADRERAASLARVFQDAGYTVWWDTHLRTGDEWFRRILQEVREAKCLVGVWTHRSIDADGLFAPSADDGHNYISIEHDVAGRAKITGAVFEARAVPLVYRDLQAALLTDWDMADASHPGLASLIKRVGELAGFAAAVPSAPVYQGPPVAPDLNAVAAPAPEPPPAAEAQTATFENVSHVSETNQSRRNVGALPPVSSREFEELRRLLEADAEERSRREWVDWLGLEAARAALAAKAGKSVTERTFPLRLDGVPSWPNPPMVAIPPGRFLMGAAEGEEGASKHEFPQHEVQIDYHFALGQHTVTFTEWDAAMMAGADIKKGDDLGWGRGRRPAHFVSYRCAQNYLAWLNGRLGLAGRPDAYRLPSEAEWEYACRAGTTSRFSFGAKIIASQARFLGWTNLTVWRTASVGSFPANAFGLHDMHGNVWEWCADPWHDDYDGAPTDGSVWQDGDHSRRVLRGGSWINVARYLRSASRLRSARVFGSYYAGFRVARTLSPPPP